MDVVASSRTTRSSDLYVSFSRTVGIVFFLVALYTVAVKLPADGLAEDWAHTAFHVVTGGLAVILGWLSPSRLAPNAFTWAVVCFYGLLGVVGWFIEGIAMEYRFRIPLGIADNVFHLGVSVTGLGFLVQAGRARRSATRR